jgi:hypothetical protein
LAPHAAKLSAPCLPIPDEAPVTNTVRPDKSKLYPRAMVTRSSPNTWNRRFQYPKGCLNEGRRHVNETFFALD